MWLSSQKHSSIKSQKQAFSFATTSSFGLDVGIVAGPFEQKGISVSQNSSPKHEKNVKDLQKNQVRQGKGGWHLEQQLHSLG